MAEKSIIRSFKRVTDKETNTVTEFLIGTSARLVEGIKNNGAKNLMEHILVGSDVYSVSDDKEITETTEKIVTRQAYIDWEINRHLDNPKPFYGTITEDYLISDSNSYFERNNTLFSPEDSMEYSEDASNKNIYIKEGILDGSNSSVVINTENIGLPIKKKVTLFYIKPEKTGGIYKEDNYKFICQKLIREDKVIADLEKDINYFIHKEAIETREDKGGKNKWQNLEALLKINS